MPVAADINLRIAGAPISWGVCEVPGWGYQMPAERVLAEMQELGLTATEFGPDGFLPDDAHARKRLLEQYGLQAVGGFVPVVLHDPLHDPLPEVDSYIEACLVTNAGVVVLAASTGQDGYERRPDLDAAQWKTLLHNLNRLADLAERRGVTAVVHPHVGTMIENAYDVQRVVDGSRIGLCIDTGHLAAAGADPVAITLANIDRVAHVHLKDVDAEMAASVFAGQISFAEAVRDRMWKVLGEGSVDVATMVDALTRNGYTGWYVLEQDLMLTDGEPNGEGPKADVRRCMNYLATTVSG